MASVPTPAQVERAILDHIGTQNVRPGEIFNFMQMSMKLHQQGFRSEEIADAVEKLGNAGHLEEASGPFLKITASGYALI